MFKKSRVERDLATPNIGADIGAITGILLKLPKFSTASTRMIRIEVVRSSIPYLDWNWDHSSSLKSVISEAGLYNIIPNISFTAISARYFNILLFQ
jgi:hypothetical protein